MGGPSGEPRTSSDRPNSSSRYRLDAAAIIALRRRQFLTADALARRAGLGPATLSRLERGHAEARVSTVRKLAAALGVNPDQIVADQTPPAGDPGDAHSARIAELAHIRTALGDLVVEIDPHQFFGHVAAGADASESADLPALDPPLSATIVDERQDRL